MSFELNRLFDRNKNNKFNYYLINYLRQLIPNKYYHAKLYKRLSEPFDHHLIEKRINYYNKLKDVVDLNNEATQLSEISLKNSAKVYFFDLKEYSRYFDQSLKGHFLFGDITKIPNEPSLVKSRPIASDNSNSILLKWNKIRHFIFINKPKIEFADKKNMLVGRGMVHKPQPHRVDFLEKYFGHPLCDIGKTNHNDLNPKWVVQKMTIDEQLKYKFILCLEGNDVASNLKWVMSSNSIAVMPKPKFETWFMEGLLIPDFHYILIKDDYSDLEEKLNFYIKHTEESLKIVENANKHVAQFRDNNTEDIISLHVLKKYFEKTNQAF